MADRDREGIGRVRRRRRLDEPEDRLDHPLHLLLVGATVAADRLLDARRRILGAGHARARARDEHGAARLTDGERGAGVDADERLLERDGIRRMLGDERLDAVEDRLEAELLRLVGGRPPPPVREIAQASVSLVDDPVPACSRPRVDADDLHGNTLGTGTDVSFRAVSASKGDNGGVRVALAALVVAIAAAAVFAGLFFTNTPQTRTRTVTVTLSKAPCGEQHLYGYVRSLVKKGATYQMQFDPAVFTTGQTANVAAAQDHVIAPGEAMPNDNYVVNESRRTYLYLVPSSTPVRVLTMGANTGGSPVTVAQLAELVAGASPVKLFEPISTGFWMWVHVDTACDLRQQYHP